MKTRTETTTFRDVQQHLRGTLHTLILFELDGVMEFECTCGKLSLRVEYDPEVDEQVRNEFKERK